MTAPGPSTSIPAITSVPFTVTVPDGMSVTVPGATVAEPAMKEGTPVAGNCVMDADPHFNTRWLLESAMYRLPLVGDDYSSVCMCVWCGVVWCGVLCVVCGVWCVVCGVLCVVCGVWCVVCGVWCVVCGVWCVVRGVW